MVLEGNRAFVGHAGIIEETEPPTVARKSPGVSSSEVLEGTNMQSLMSCSGRK